MADRAIRRPPLLLSGNAEWLRTLFQQAPGGLAVITGPNHTFEMANDAYQRLVGRRDLVGMSAREALPGVTREGLIGSLNLVYSTGQRCMVSATPIMVEPEPGAEPIPHYVDFIYQPIKAADGSVTGVLAYGHEVTEHKRAVIALADSEERFRALVTATPSVLWRAAPNGSIIQLTGLDGYPGAQEDLLGYGWLTLVHPGDRERLTSEWQNIVESEAPAEAEFRFRGTGEVFRWVSCRAAPLKDPNGSVREWVGTMSDIHGRKEAEASLVLRERSLAAIAQGVVITDATLPHNPIVYTNPAFEQLTGYSADEVVGRNCRFLQGSDTEEKVVARIRVALEAGQTVAETLLNYKKDGTPFVNELTISPVRAADGSVTHFVGTQTDVTERQRLQDRLRIALHAGRMVAWEQNLDTNYVTRSENALELLGIGSGPLSEFLERIVPTDRSRRERFPHQLNPNSPETIEFRYRLPNGHIMWFGSRAEKAGPNRIVGVSFDITDRKAAEEENWRAANHDSLTGLPNRILFQNRWEQGLADAKQNGTSVTLLLIDLDDFKDVNDTLGHDAGDALLKELSARLKGMVRECDTVARLGGDEFAILLVEPLRLEHAARFAGLVKERLREPISYSGRTFVSRSSIGIAAFPDHHDTSTDLMKAADIALYRAKSQGRSRIVTYSPTMSREIQARVSLAAEVREAISNDQVIPYYQPKVCLSTGTIIGLEALARWQHPTRGILTPQHFGAVFRDHHLAAAIGQRMVAKVANDVRQWLDEGLNPGRVAVNLSSAEFTHPAVATSILEVLDHLRVPTKNFEVEVTETVLLGRNPDDVSAILEQFNERGVQIALDDFGTGYASLTHLKQFPVGHIKIDQSFVTNIEHSPDDVAIVSALVGLGTSLNLHVTAEGVETEGQARRLRALGCHNAQGFLYARPMAARQVGPFLAEFKTSQR